MKADGCFDFDKRYQYQNTLGSRIQGIGIFSYRDSAVHPLTTMLVEERICSPADRLCKSSPNVLRQQQRMETDLESALWWKATRPVSAVCSNQDPVASLISPFISKPKHSRLTNAHMKLAELTDRIEKGDHCYVVCQFVG